MWGWGGQPAHQLVVKQASRRLRLIQAFAAKHPLAPKGLTCRPRLLPLPQSEQSPDQALQTMEASWLASVHANLTGTTRLRADQPDSPPAWMTPAHASRFQHQQQRDEQQQHQRQSHQQQPQLPSERAAASDTIDVLVACGTLSSHSGGASGSCPMLPTLTGSTGPFGGASCMAA